MEKYDQKSIFLQNLVSFPGQLIDLELPELPIPNAEGINKYTTTFEIPHKSDNAICDTIFTIQNYVYENGIRISEFMEPFDVLKSGSITRNQFVRALDCVGISESKRLRLGEREFESIFSTYADPIDFSRVKWKHFCDEIDKGPFFIFFSFYLRKFKFKIYSFH